MTRRDLRPRPPEDPAKLVADLARAHITARCLHVIADCGAADAVGPIGATPAEIAAHTGLDCRRARSHAAIARRARHLQRTAPTDVTSIRRPRCCCATTIRARCARTCGWTACRRSGIASRSSATRREPAVRSTTWASLVEYFAAHPEESAIFNAAMVSKSRTVLPAVAAAYDFSALRHDRRRRRRPRPLARARSSSARRSARGVLFELAARDRRRRARCRASSSRPATSSPTRCRQPTAIC